MAKLGETVGEAASKLQIKKAQPGNEKHRIMLVGPSNEGKTTGVATYSKFWKQDTDLKDMVWLLVDGGGLDSVTSQGHTVDMFDLTETPAKYIVRDMKNAIQMAREMVEAGKKSAVVLDSFSTLDGLIQAKIKPDYEGNKFGYWDAVLEAHMSIYGELVALPCTLLGVSHLTPVSIMGEGEAAVKAQKKLQAEGLKEGDLKMDISGRAYRFYKNNFPEIWPIKATGKAPDREYKVYPYGFAGMEAKTKHTCWSKDGDAVNLRSMVERMQNQK